MKNVKSSFLCLCSLIGALSIGTPSASAETPIDLSTDPCLVWNEELLLQLDISGGPFTSLSYSVTDSQFIVHFVSNESTPNVGLEIYIDPVAGGCNGESATEQFVAGLSLSNLGDDQNIGELFGLPEGTELDRDATDCLLSLQSEDGYTYFRIENPSAGSFQGSFVLTLLESEEDLNSLSNEDLCASDSETPGFDFDLDLDHYRNLVEEAGVGELPGTL
jgi:hypothetical protein